jgi:hypothetical protein
LSEPSLSFFDLFVQLDFEVFLNFHMILAIAYQYQSLIRFTRPIKFK